VFVDALLAHAAVFSVGQAVALLYLRRGRFWLGVGVTALLWASLDWWLVTRYVLSLPPEGVLWPLLCLYGSSSLAVLIFLFASIRKRLAAPHRQDRYGTGVRLLLSGDWDSATRTFRQLTRSDPGDAAAWIGLGDAARRLDRKSQARRCYRRARAVDVSGIYSDLVAHRADLLLRKCGVQKERITPATPEVAVAKKQRVKPAAGG
jgi:hypothetical protein